MRTALISTRASLGRALVLLVALVALVACGGASADYRSSNARAAPAAPTQSVASGPPPMPMADTAVSGNFFGDVLEEEGDWSAGDGNRRREVKKVETAQAEPGQSVESPPAPGAAEDDGLPDPPSTRMIIYTAGMGLYVLDVALAIERTMTFAESLGGWMQASTSTSLTLRVPAENFEAFVDGLADIGRITEQNIVGVDVTEEYYDVEIRLANAVELRERLTELLAKATTVEETLAIERELARLTTEIETLKGRARYLRENAAFSTVTVAFYEDASQLPAGKRVHLPFDWLTRYSLEQLYQSGYYY